MLFHKIDIPQTIEEINAKATSKGGFTRKLVESWGVSWPLQKGWKKALIAEQKRLNPPSVLPAKKVDYDWFYHVNCSCPNPDSPGFDPYKHGTLAPPRMTYRLIK